MLPKLEIAKVGFYQNLTLLPNLSYFHHGTEGVISWLTQLPHTQEIIGSLPAVPAITTNNGEKDLATVLGVLLFGIRIKKFVLHKAWVR